MKEQNKIYIIMVLLGFALLSSLILDFQQNDAILKTKDVLIELQEQDILVNESIGKLISQDIRIVNLIGKQAEVDSGLLGLIESLYLMKQDKLTAKSKLGTFSVSSRSTGTSLFDIDNNSAKIVFDTESTSKLGIISSSFTPVIISKEYCEESGESGLSWSFKCYNKPIEEND